VDLTREAIQKIQELVEGGEPKVLEIEGRTYTTKKLEPVLWPVSTPLPFPSLAGLVAFFGCGLDTNGPDMRRAVHVVSHGHVRIISEEFGPRLQRHVLAEASPEWPAFPFGSFREQEAFLIGLQTLFVRTAILEDLLRICGVATADEIRMAEDDGVTQTLTAKAGITFKDRVQLPSPVTLQPFRTFREVEQPPSPFILRARRSPAGGLELALFEADGGAWKLEALERVKKYLREQLPGALILG